MVLTHLKVVFISHLSTWYSMSIVFVVFSTILLLSLSLSCKYCTLTLYGDHGACLSLKKYFVCLFVSPNFHGSCQKNLPLAVIPLQLQILKI